MLYNKAYGSTNPSKGKAMSRQSSNAIYANTPRRGSVISAPSREQKYLLLIYSVISFVVTGIFGVMHLVIWHNPSVGLIEITCGTLLFINFLVHLKYHNYRVACTIFLFIMTSFLLTLLVSGGRASTGILWFFTFPFTAFFLAGKKQGAWWNIALLATTVAIILFAPVVSVELPYEAAILQQMILVFIILTAGIYVYQSSSETLQDQSQVNRQDLQEEKIKSDAIIDSIGEAVVVTDPDEHIIIINAAAESMFGWQLRELKGEKFTEKIPVMSEKPISIFRPIQQSLATLKKVVATTVYVRKDGSSFPAGITVTPIIVADKLAGAVCTIRDIQDEQGVDKAKNEFVTLASHQLRTPASAVAWMSELLLSGDIGRLTKEQKEYIHKIYNSNRRLTDLLDDMLIVFSIELGNLSMAAAPTHIPSVARREVKNQLKKLEGVKKLHITESYDNALPEILTDSTAIKGITSRLISNAIKYTPDGGKLEVSVRHSHEKLTRGSKGSFLIEVTDNGYGIPKHQAAKVFTKLFRADNIKKKDTDGTGLGLYIARALVERMGGKIWFTSEQNKGSRFSVLLPIEGIKEPA